MAQIGKMTEARVVRTPHGRYPYKVVMEAGRGRFVEHSVMSVREAEALIRAHRMNQAIFETSAEVSALRLIAGSRE